MMLSRVAESLYWIGRYVERAEDTSRLLDVHLQAMLEDPWVDEGLACREVLQVMGLGSLVEDGAILDARTTTRLLAFEREGTSSIAGALTAARENARGVREALSSELWECLNATYHSLASQEAAAKRLGPHGFLRYVRDRSATVSGLINGTMPRDDGWRFLMLGRSLERVDMTARLLWLRSGRGSGRAWVELLQCCSAYEAYLRTYRAAVEPERVLEFLILDRLFPRSMYASLSLAESCLSDLGPIVSRTGVDDEGRRLIGRARTGLEFRRPDRLLDDLPSLLTDLQSTCAQVGDAMVERYFHHAPSTAWALDVG